MTALRKAAGLIGALILMVNGVGRAQVRPSSASQAENRTAKPATARLSGSPIEAVVESVSTSDIVVTGSRVVRDGYEAPTPTTVLDGDRIAADAPTNLADLVNELPSLSGSISPRTSVGAVSPGLVGINALNLRNLGANRTLVLVDGQRVAASTLTGLVDINTIPQALTKRVDVVTGGVSAGWGSDAVAGVVNFVLDTGFVGTKTSAQAGLTTYGDGRNHNAQVTVGRRFAEGRGHLLLNVETAFNEGIESIGERDWYAYKKILINPAYNASSNNTVPQLIVARDAGFTNATPGGIITSGPLRGTYFGSGGTPAQFRYGSIIGGNIMVGGDARYADYGLSGDIEPRLKRNGFFGRVGFDVAPRTEMFAQLSYNRAIARVRSLVQFNFGNIRIRSDNAFIPPPIASRVEGDFLLGTLNADLGPIVSTTDRRSQRWVIGIRGGFDALGSGWTWDAHGQRTVNHIYTGARTSITSRYNQAIDAVRNADGAIVCRSTLTDPTNGCVPFNVFGTGVVSDAARAYVLGTSFGDTRLYQNVVAGTLRGNPVSTWAGPVSIATGLEFRSERVAGTNDPLSSTQAYFAGNYVVSRGSYDVSEAFAETVVPLSRAEDAIGRVDLNAAVRSTTYSTSGRVATWKLGMTWSPSADLTFRAVRSRDIRAPNLAELFQAGQSSVALFNDPFRNNLPVTATQLTAGSRTLNPEKAATLGVGAILRPRALPGLAGSLDLYDVTIDGAITTYDAGSVVTFCRLGNLAFCNFVERAEGGTPVNGLFPITRVAVMPVNIAKIRARGLDMEASYRHPLGGGTVTLRGLATRYLKNETSDGITSPTDTVGTNGANGRLRNSLPKWKYVLSAGYDRGAAKVLVTARGFSAGVYNTSYVGCTTSCPPSTPGNMTINDNRLPGALYVDMSVTSTLRRGVEAFLVIDNIANRDPAQVATGPAIVSPPLSVNPLLYEVLGRTFRAGVRVAFD